MEKECFKCRCVLPLSEYYKHPKMLDGHLNKCKECTKRDVSEHRSKNLGSVRAYDRQRGRKHNRTTARNASLARRQLEPDVVAADRLKRDEWRYRNRHKTRAHSRVQHAISRGSLCPKPCEMCGDDDTQAHHPDYSLPLVVQWLCVQCHADVHVEERDWLRQQLLLPAPA